MVVRVGTPERPARLQLADGRRDALVKYISVYLAEHRLTGAEASSLYGRLGFVLNSVQGKFGRAFMRPIKRRQRELRSNMNRQLEACLQWWRRFLMKHVSRSVPVSLVDKKVVVSYSDGEGSGGVWGRPFCPLVVSAPELHSSRFPGYSAAFGRPRARRCSRALTSGTSSRSRSLAPRPC